MFSYLLNVQQKINYCGVETSYVASRLAQCGGRVSMNPDGFGKVELLMIKTERV